MKRLNHSLPSDRTPGIPAKPERAFTLVELAVVIATLAILGGLILPALAKSGDNSARTVCLNNLRQMGTALNLYTAENQDYLPWPNWGNDSSPPTPRGWLYAGNCTSIPITTVVGGPGAINNWSARQVVHLQQGVFWQYVLNGKAFLCPNDLKPSLTGLWAQRQNTLSTYVMNGAACFFANPNNQYVYLTPKVSQIWSPSCVVMWEPDQNLDNGCYNDGANYPGPDVGSAAQEGFAALHTPGVHLLTVSGGTRVLSSADTTAAQTTPGNGILWWNPKTTDGR